MRVRGDMKTVGGQQEAVGGRHQAHLPAGPSPRVLIGGVGYRWSGDASFGLVAADEMARQTWPPGIEIADLGYGALYVAQDLADARPPYDRLILIVGVERGREPGRIYRSRWEKKTVSAEELQARIREAGAGVVDLDHLLLIADYFAALPQDVELIELEPLDTCTGERLSPAAAERLAEVTALVRDEVIRSLPTRSRV